MKKYFLLILLLFTVGFAAPSETYFDLGAGTMPLQPKKKCTYMSIGKRVETYKGSVDLSLSHRITPSYQQYVWGRVMLTKNLNEHVYVGVGPGIGSFIDYKGGRFSTAEAMTLEGVFGVELPKGSSRVTPKFEVGLSQPVVVFHNGTGRTFDPYPAVTASLKLTY